MGIMPIKHSAHAVEAPYLAAGWIAAQPPGETLARLEDGTTVHLDPVRFLPFGTPVTVRVCDVSHHGRLVYGEIVNARPLSFADNTARPRAYLDAANISTEGRTPERWAIGAVALWAVAWELDDAGYSPAVVADPGFLRAAQAHPPSSRVLHAIRARMVRERGWRWVCKDDGICRKGIADRVYLRAAEADPMAIIITRDHLRDHMRSFPWLGTDTGRGRIHAPIIHDGLAELPSLGVSAVLPTALFNGRQCHG